MTKEEIYEEATLKNIANSTGTRMDIIYHAMSEYAKQEAIKFAEFISANTTKVRFVWNKGNWQIFNKNGGIENITSQELYSLYLQSKNQ